MVKRMKTTVRWMLALILMVLAGCAKMEPALENYIDIAKSKGISSDYLNALAKWTKKTVIYSEFETRALVIATYRGQEFRQAYDREYNRLYAVTPQEQDRRNQIKEELASEYTEFFFYAYNPEPDTLDFSKANSIWKIFLINGQGDRMEPVEIRQITKITPLIEQFYPYVNPYHGKFYSIKFPPSKSLTQGRQADWKLVFTGVLGKLEVSWP